MIRDSEFFPRALRGALRRMVITEVGDPTSRGRIKVALVGDLSREELEALRKVVFADTTQL